MTKHGAPDWYKYRRDSSTFPVDDLAELAARLGSADTFDRRGDVIFMDDFGGGAPGWFRDSGGHNSEVSLSPLYALHGGWSMKLVPGSTLPMSAEISRNFAYPALSKLGFEVTLSMDMLLDDVRIQVYFYTGTYLYRAIIALDHANTRLRYYDVDGNLEILDDDVDPSTLTLQFSTVKFVCDFLTGYYTRLIFNSHHYDMSAYQMRRVPPGTPPRICFEIVSYSQAGKNTHTYVDNVIITQDEP